MSRRLLLLRTALLATLAIGTACTTPQQDTSMPNAAPAIACTTSATGQQRAPTPEPEVLRLLSRTERFTVPVERSTFTTWFDGAPLERLLPGGGGIAAVAGTQAIGNLSFPAPRSRRLVCLADGSTALEEVLEHQPGQRLRYIVWAYTTAAAEPIAYGVGEFVFTDAPSGTAVEWTYAFRLKQDRFPGMLGATGRSLFRVAFLDTRYARFMKAGVEAITREGVAAQRSRQAVRNFLPGVEAPAS